ncbi:DUF3592 domain-containing protein [Streptomyces sp. NPDC001514]
MSGIEWLSFAALVGLPILGLGFLFARLLRRLLRILRVMTGGAKAEGVCVDVRDTSSRSDPGTSHRHHVFAFETGEGQRIEYVEDAASMGTPRGYRTTVHYDPADPARTATIAGRDDMAPVLVPGCALVATGVFLVILFWIACTVLL